MTLHTLRLQIQDWYTGRTPRERLLLSLSLLLASGILLHTAVWQPLNDKLEKAERRLKRLRHDIALMQSMLPEITALQRRATTDRPRRDQRSLQTVINQTSANFNLQDKIRQITPSGTEKIQVSLQRANFNQLIRWLGLLQKQHQINVLTLATERHATLAGIVDAQILFARTNQ